MQFSPTSITSTLLGQINLITNSNPIYCHYEHVRIDVRSGLIGLYRHTMELVEMITYLMADMKAE
jgi:hypothetical protein